MNAILSLGFVLTLSCAAVPEPVRQQTLPPTADEPQPRSMLTYQLEAAESYGGGEKVILGFTLENNSGETLFVLDWYTPIEGIFGNIFRVTRDGEDVEYQGILAKRGNPLREDYVRLEPDQSVSAEVDLARGYDLSVAGEYAVRFNGRIHDVTVDESSLPRDQDDHRGVEIEGNAVRFRVDGP